MSRFVEILESRHGILTQDGIFRMLDEMLLRLEARSGRIELAFPYFIRKTAPVSVMRCTSPSGRRSPTKRRPLRQGLGASAVGWQPRITDASSGSGFFPPRRDP